MRGEREEKGRREGGEKEERGRRKGRERETI